MEPRRTSFSASDATYHSFHDIELQEPPSPPSSRNSKDVSSQAAGPADHHSCIRDETLVATEMRRQDSGYASNMGSRRSSTSISRKTRPTHRTTSASPPPPPSGPTRRSCTRLSTHRSVRSFPQSHRQALQQQQLQQQQVAYFHFPTPDLIELTETDPADSGDDGEPASPPPLPPPTTHYWTSDSTRRLEYAAIDAASRGFKGWVRRNLVPDCFVGPRPVVFDDDTGSVRRYRLDLDDEGDDEAGSGTSRPEAGDAIPPMQQRKGWSFWPLGKTRTL